MNRKIAFLSILAAAAFASAPVPASTKPAIAAKSTTKPVATGEIEFTEVRTDIAAPARSTRVSTNPFDVKARELPVGGSFGIKGKKKANFSTRVSKLNNAASNMVELKDANGVTVMKAGDPIKDANGNVVGTKPATPEMVRLKEWQINDVDPAKDEDGASVRVFRLK